MKIVCWFICPVIGTGIVTEEKDDAYRPAIADLPILQHAEWSAVYYPSRSPYEFCVVRAVIERDIPTPSQAKKLDVKGMKKLGDDLPYFRRRWLDQPNYPAVKYEDKTKEEQAIDPVETRYMRQDSHTINTRNWEKFLTTNTAVLKEKTYSRSLAGNVNPTMAYFITTQLEATKLEATEQTGHLWAKISTLTNIEFARVRFRVFKIPEDGSLVNIGVSNEIDVETTWQEKDCTFNCPETDLVATDAISIIVDGHIYTTIPVSYTFYFNCGNATYPSRVTNFSWSAAVAYEKTLTESLGLVDTVVKAPSLIKSEALGLVDTYSRIWMIYRIYSELLGLVDTYSRVWSIHRTYSELLALVDSVQKEPGKMFAEPLGLVDTYSRTWSIYRTYTELLGLLDSIQKGQGKVLSEPLGLVDTYSRTWSIKRTYVEPLGLVDTYSRVHNIHRTFTELLGLLDSIQKKPGKTFTEKLGVADSFLQLTWRDVEEIVGKIKVVFKV